MFKALTPVIAILVAVGLFFTYVQPTFDEIRAVQDETHDYDEAISKAEQLRDRINELNRQKNSISLTNLERLEAFLPDRVDEVELLIAIDALADTHNLAFGDIIVGGESAEAAAESARNRTDEDDMPDNDGSPGDQYEQLDIGFTVTGTYEDFREFLKEVERSLVLMEVTEIAFTESEGDLIEFMLDIRVFSLKPIS